jgi:hypothetical protein
MLRNTQHEIVAIGQVECEVYLHYPPDCDPLSIIEVVTTAASGVLHKVDTAPAVTIMPMPILSVET